MSPRPLQPGVRRGCRGSRGRQVPGVVPIRHTCRAQQSLESRPPEGQARVCGRKPGPPLCCCPGPPPLWLGSVLGSSLENLGSPGRKPQRSAEEPGCCGLTGSYSGPRERESSLSALTMGRQPRWRSLRCGRRKPPPHPPRNPENSSLEEMPAKRRDENVKRSCCL